ncbi:MAG: hypothetical protein ACK4JY_03370 [Brevundimonas sp.]|uniref:Abi-alpha family protein n=1 Tax=Brevundimonas sp. TaxID=1871086 RepID=UPI00391D4EA0
MDIDVDADASRTIVDALRDTLSPLTEALGAVGDQIRVYRTRAALRAIGDTAKIAEQNNLRLKAPPLNFLIPYLEEASLADETDDSLMDRWANLLANASTDGKQVPRNFIDILGRLSSADAEAFDALMRGPRHGASHVRLIVERQYMLGMIDIENEIAPLIRVGDEASSLQRIISELEDRGQIVTYVGFHSYDHDGGQYDEWVLHPAFEEDDIRLHTLASLGLITYPVQIKRPYEGGNFTMHLAVVTRLGAEFFFDTHDAKLREEGSKDFE